MTSNDGGRPTAQDAWAVMQEGNGRWRRDEREDPRRSAEVRAAVVSGQEPMAMVLSCSDSRVPAELVFDLGLGDLFVVRTAGQVVDDAVLGTLAFGAGALGIPLLVVLGHSQCGAVKAAVSVAGGVPAARPGDARGAGRRHRPGVRGRRDRARLPTSRPRWTRTSGGWSRS